MGITDGFSVIQQILPLLSNFRYVFIRPTIDHSQGLTIHFVPAIQVIDSNHGIPGACGQQPVHHRRCTPNPRLVPSRPAGGSIAENFQSPCFTVLLPHQKLSSIE
jgi:hypothetical protein